MFELENSRDSPSSVDSDSNLRSSKPDEQNYRWPRNRNDGQVSVSMKLGRKWLLFKYRHPLLFEGGKYTRILATLAFMGTVAVFAPLIVSLLYVPQPFTSFTVYGGWTLGGMAVIWYAQTVGRYYDV